MKKAGIIKNIKTAGNKALSWINSSDSENISPALLFIRSNTSRMPQVYLFSKFGLAKSAEVGQQSQITTHYTEENNHINDHWALSPMTYTLTGLIGELIYTPPEKWANYAAALARDYASIVNLIAPNLDVSTQTAYNIAQFTEANVKRYKQTLRQSLSNLGVLKAQTQKTNQEYVFQQLWTLQLNRQLIEAIQTPYGTFNNMAIANVRMGQNDNRFMSTVTVDLQQWRDVIPAGTRKATDTEKADMAKLQQSLVNNQGVASTQEVKRTTLKSKIMGWSS